MFQSGEGWSSVATECHTTGPVLRGLTDLFLDNAI